MVISPDVDRPPFLSAPIIAENAQDREKRRSIKINQGSCSEKKFISVIHYNRMLRNCQVLFVTVVTQQITLCGR